MALVFGGPSVAGQRCARNTSEIEIVDVGSGDATVLTAPEIVHHFGEHEEDGSILQGPEISQAEEIDGTSATSLGVALVKIHERPRMRNDTSRGCVT